VLVGRLVEVVKSSSPMQCEGECACLRGGCVILDEVYSDWCKWEVGKCNGRDVFYVVLLVCVMVMLVLW
jgi:hypothetical protein